MSRIAVCLSSRGRSASLIGVIMSLWRLRSERHEIIFSVGFDAGDYDTVRAAGMCLQDGAVVTVSHRLPEMLVRGCADNAAIAACKDADIFVLVSDRLYCITPGWDEIIARSCEPSPARVQWWRSVADPDLTFPIVPRAYMEAIDFKWSPEIFPFWYDDTWHAEIDMMLHGVPPLKAPVYYGGARGRTRGAHDIAFWQRVFAALRPRRRQQAGAIAERCGFRIVTRNSVEEYFAFYDADMVQRSSALEDIFADKDAPDERYREAYESARQLL